MTTLASTPAPNPVPGLTRKPVFWIAFALVSALCMAFAVRYFPQALPLVNLDVKMTREGALDAAGALAGKLKLAPADFRRAALFAHDGETQNYVELEGGGKSRFAALLSGEIYAPYWWEVRLFKPGETAETHVRFRPDGSPYGFSRKIAETDPGAVLDAAAAKAIAEQSATRDWGIDFKPYKLLEQSQVEQPSKRVDHFLVYERTDADLGEGKFRLRLGVAGDQLNDLSYFVHVPEAFERHYTEMRSTNNLIARVASMAAGLLYGVGGCVLGALWLLRRRSLLWKQALIAGAVVAGINAAAQLANATQAWFGFDTAQSISVFWGQQAGIAALILVAGTLALALVFMAAESLSRNAFPDHPQLWRLWSRPAAPTPAILGRTAGAYLWVPIELALIAAFYLVTNRYFGWWQPSESLTDPNILGSALPALEPIGMALQAGFMEECLFRAIPLSIAALLGARFGHRGVFIGVTLVLQAVIFGAAHANYPGFPAYSRLVELVVPAFIWGMIFLRFGLLTTVILHAVFDLILMSIPLFLVDGGGSSVNRALVIAAGLVPVAVVVIRRMQAGQWLTLPASLRNGAWQAGAAVAYAPVVHTQAKAGAITQQVQRFLPVLGLAGLAAIALGGDFRSDAPPLSNDRAAAERSANAALQARGVALGPEWRQGAVTRMSSDDSSAWLWHKFVWRKGGPDVYAKLMGTWLAPPLWEVRYARFDAGDVADRAEEWRVTVAGDGTVRQVRHQLPEGRAGAKLSRDEARLIAQRAIKDNFGIDASTLHEVSADEEQRPARADWQFVYADPSVNAGAGGEARILLGIAGNEVVSSGRFVFVPEDWQRSERERGGRFVFARAAVGVLGLLLGVGGLILAILAWSRGQFDRPTFLIAVGIASVATVMGGLQSWPAFAAQLKTTEPLTRQIGLWIAGIGFGMVGTTLLTSLLAGVAAWAARTHVRADISARDLIVRGLSAGLLVTGIRSLASLASSNTVPNWPRYGLENAWTPAFEAVFSPLSGLMLTFAATIVVLYWLDRFTSGWQRRRVLVFVLLVAIEAAFSAARADDWMSVVAAGLFGGALTTFLFATILRFDLRIVPAFVSAQTLVGIVSDALEKRTSHALTLCAIQAVTVIVFTWLVTRYLSRTGVEDDVPPAVEPAASASPSG